MAASTSGLMRSDTGARCGFAGHPGSGCAAGAGGSAVPLCPVGAILEAHGAGQAAGQLAVALAFGGACADGAPADEFADELG